MQNHIDLGEGDRRGPPPTPSATTSRSRGARFLNRNHEHLFHLTLSGDVGLDRLAVGVPFKRQIQHCTARPRPGSNAAGAIPGSCPYDTVQKRAGKIRSSRHVPARLCPAGASACTASRVPTPWCSTHFPASAPPCWLAALAEGGQGIGIEIDPAYVATAEARLAAAAARGVALGAMLQIPVHACRAVRDLPGRSAPAHAWASPPSSLLEAGRLPGGGATGADLLRPAGL